MKYNDFIKFVKNVYNTNEFITLHAPVFTGNEKKYLNECIDTTFVSYVGKFVNDFEKKTADYVGIENAVATASGTAALHIALMLSGVKKDELVITQALTFVATVNALSYCGAEPLFIDVSRKTLGMDPDKLEDYFKNKTIKKGNGVYDKETRKRIAACLPIHIFGHPAEIDKIIEICTNHDVPIVEDSAESLGSFYKGKHTGSFGDFGILSYNGNKTITTGGGGMILTKSKEKADLARYITTTAKRPHKYEYFHDMIGYNYRLPNVNAAIGVAQMENLDKYLQNKRELADLYREFFINTDIEFVTEPANCTSNYWLNAIILKDRQERDIFLEETNGNNVMTRPIWVLMHKLPMYNNCRREDLSVSEWFEDRIVNIPSGVRIRAYHSSQI